MSKPIPQKEPKEVELQEGKRYSWCNCALSSEQPFCDGSHKGTEYRPIPFKAEKSENAWLCVCKRTGNPPYCDGTHNTL